VPSEPPWRLFPGESELPVDTPLRQLNLWMLRHAGIHTSVFQSAHVSGALAAGLVLPRLLPKPAWPGWMFRGLAVLVPPATIYGRYHYAPDAIAGLAVGLIAYGVYERTCSG